MGEAGLRLKVLLWGFTVGPGNCPSSLPGPLAQLHHRGAQEAVGVGQAGGGSDEVDLHLLGPWL